MNHAVKKDNRVIIAIDAKSFYASVECVERHCDPLTTNLVVADTSRTEKTICLAVSPSLKAIGIPGRPRLFEVIQKVKEVNRERLSRGIQKGCIQKDSEGEYHFASVSFDARALEQDASLEIGYITAPPRMHLYEIYSTKIYGVYLKYFAPEDIIVYSIDEVFIDATRYIELYRMTPYELTMAVIREVLYTTGITATAGIGTNLYLAKIAMDIMAKRVMPDQDGVRIAELDEMTYRKALWTHRPLTDFWRIGHGIAKKLEAHHLLTMGDIALCSLGKAEDYYNADLLYRLFGVNAELLIDHAWGIEPVTVEAVKAYRPSATSLSSGQVLSRPYTFSETKIIVEEMTDALALDLIRKKLMTEKLVLTISYDRKSLENTDYNGPVTRDHYGRLIPKHAHGTVNIDHYTNSGKQIMSAMMSLYEEIVNPDLLVKRVNVCACDLLSEDNPIIRKENTSLQLDFLTDYTKKLQTEKETEAAENSERNLQRAILTLKTRYGKNTVFKGNSLLEGATARERNAQIGGHKA